MLMDVRNYTSNPQIAQQLRYFDSQVRNVALPNPRYLTDAFCDAGAEAMYTAIEKLTKDGRDRSLDCKFCDVFVARGSCKPP
ncbi:MAG: hypothetical protein JSR91_22205 [Proteobacteria bacterium]|nr:hypothetical protein [Pseudomonadota bacterium]